MEIKYALQSQRNWMKSGRNWRWRILLTSGTVFWRVSSARIFVTHSTTAPTWSYATVSWQHCSVPSNLPPSKCDDKHRKMTFEDALWATDSITNLNFWCNSFDDDDDEDNDSDNRFPFVYQKDSKDDVQSTTTTSTIPYSGWGKQTARIFNKDHVEWIVNSDRGLQCFQYVWKILSTELFNAGMSPSCW